MDESVEWRERSRLLRFFGDHETCGKGFEFRHPDPPGQERLSVRCKACGAETEYSATEEDAPKRPRAQTRRAPIARPHRTGVGIGERLRANRADLLTAGLVLLAAATGIFAVVRLAGDRGSPASTPTNSVSAATATSPAPSEPKSPAPSEPAQSPAPSEPAPSAVPATGSREAVADGGPTIVVPSGWSSHSNNGAEVFAPKGPDDVVVRIYYQRRPDLTPEEMRSLARSVLERDHPSGRIEPADPLAGAFFKGWLATYDGGTEHAQGLYRQDVGVLILARISGSASPGDGAEALAVANSVRI